MQCNGRKFNVEVVICEEGSAVVGMFGEWCGRHCKSKNNGGNVWGLEWEVILVETCGEGHARRRVMGKAQGRRKVRQ